MVDASLNADAGQFRVVANTAELGSRVTYPTGLLKGGTTQAGRHRLSVDPRSAAVRGRCSRYPFLMVSEPTAAAASNQARRPMSAPRRRWETQSSAATVTNIIRIRKLTCCHSSTRICSDS
jgi:hypothetical protein